MPASKTFFDEETKVDELDEERYDDSPLDPLTDEELESDDEDQADIAEAQNGQY
ncbi:MAG: hypothetical protein WC788_08270 [Candidatus Paceibacterota bacterium]|jgi:hypothetical protein